MMVSGDNKLKNRRLSGRLSDVWKSDTLTIAIEGYYEINTGVMMKASIHLMMAFRRSYCRNLRYPFVIYAMSQ